MVTQLLIAAGIISMTIIVEVVFIGIAEAVLIAKGRFLSHQPHVLKSLIALILVTLWLTLAHSVAVWIWAIVLVLLDAFESLEPALYFSIVAFTTLGFGDVVLDDKWRLLSGLSASNGLLVFGISTAFLVEFFSRIRQLSQYHMGENRNR